MAGKNQYKTSDFIEAIPGTGGVITAIASRVGCDWNTARKYLNEYKTVNEAWLAEKESILDVAESVLHTNIQVAKRVQERAIKLAQDADKVQDYDKAAREYGRAIVDTGDIKWLLKTQAKDRGYIERSELSGPDGTELKAPVYIIENRPDDK
jgi:hypothetical protein